MPFAALPSSPGFMQPQAPDWGRFASQANEMILKGGEQRAQANKDLISQMDKNAEQISKIMQYNSPEAKAERRMKMMQVQAMEQVYNDYRIHPENYLMTAHGPVVKDPFTQAMKITQYRNAITTGEINQRNLARGQKQDALTNDLDTFRKTYGNVNANDYPTAPTEAAPAGAPGSTSTTVAAPATTGTDQVQPVVDTSVNLQPAIDPDTGLPVSQ